MTSRTIRVQYLQAGMVTTLGTIATCTRHGASDVFRVTYTEGGFRTCSWGAVFTLAENG